MSSSVIFEFAIHDIGIHTAKYMFAMQVTNRPQNPMDSYVNLIRFGIPSTISTSAVHDLV